MYQLAADRRQFSRVHYLGVVPDEFGNEQVSGVASKFVSYLLFLLREDWPSVMWHL